MRVRDMWSDFGVVLSDEIVQPLVPWSVSSDFRRITRELELPRTRFHDLRHAHATQLLAAGVHPKAVSERLGHSTVAFTMDVYSAVIPSTGRRPPMPPISCSGSAGHNLATTTAHSDRRGGRLRW
jgi:Phage integrase family